MSIAVVLLTSHAHYCKLVHACIIILHEYICMLKVLPGINLVLGSLIIWQFGTGSQHLCEIEFNSVVDHRGGSRNSRMVGLYD